jgi:hypothetical protein
LQKGEALFFFCALPLFCQSNSGELRLKVTDPSGLGVKDNVQIVSEANQYRNTLATTIRARWTCSACPTASTSSKLTQPGFAAVSESVEIRSSIPTEYAIQLKVPR